MKCIVCRQGETNRGEAAATLQRGDTTVIIKGVPAEVCDNCGEYYRSDKIAEQVLSMAEEAVTKNPEVEIVRFAA